MREDFKLADSSALVLLWAGDRFYETEAARAYIAALDLARGQALYRQCQQIWPHYGEVIKNRKYGVRHLCRKYMQQQIIFAGAGFDAMGLELAAQYKESRIYEIDLADMAEKQRMLRRHGRGDNVKCVRADLSDAAQTKAALTEAGWRAAAPSILVFEGVSYYLAPRALAALTRLLSPRYVIADFLLPAAAMNEQARAIADGIFGVVQNMCDVPALARYRAEELARLISRPLVEAWPMPRLEAARTGQRHYFAEPEFSWIEIAVFG